MTRTLLAIFAHPDDETFFAGGTLARYAHQGVRVVLACATRGEAGAVNDAACCPKDLGKARAQELRCACRILGIKELRFLGYRDSGLNDPDEDQHPKALVRADPEEVVDRILRLFLEFRPQVVLSFGPDGGYGHPDHVAIHDHTLTAWRCAGNPQRCPELAPDPPRKLYYVARPYSVYRRLYEEFWCQGLLPEAPREERLRRRSTPDDAVTTTIDVSAFIETRFAALHCHRTQVAQDHPYLLLPEEVHETHFGLEFFTLADARGIAAKREERDLFAGI
jgi:LmbE family N-acetylglucosaminyl deacetylase